jgi:hypothetical protein
VSASQNPGGIVDRAIGAKKREMRFATNDPFGGIVQPADAAIIKKAPAHRFKSSQSISQ